MNEPCGARDGYCGADRHDPRFRGGRWFTDQFVGFGYPGRENGAGVHEDSPVPRTSTGR